MLILHVDVDVKPDRIPEFLEAIRDNAACAVRDEPGCLGFDVLQDTTDLTKFVFYEVYRNTDALAAHRQTPHFKRYFDRTGDLVAAPLRRHIYHNLHPDDAAWAGRTPVAPAPGMIFRLLAQQVSDGAVDAFLAGMLPLAAAMDTNEPGSLRFDALQEDDNPQHFLLYEVYRDRAAREAHRQTPHFQQHTPAIRGAVTTSEGREFHNVTR